MDFYALGSSTAFEKFAIEFKSPVMRGILTNALELAGSRPPKAPSTETPHVGFDQGNWRQVRRFQMKHMLAPFSRYSEKNRNIVDALASAAFRPERHPYFLEQMTAKALKKP
jgi:hypothetical protein